MLVDANTLHRNRVTSARLALLSATLPVAFAIYKLPSVLTSACWLAFGCLLAGFVFRQFTAKTRRRAKLLANPLSPAIEKEIEQQVAYYNCLSPETRLRFRQLVQVFLDEVPISGIDVPVTNLHRALVAASAVIPIMGFPNWEYEYLSEVLLYPANFNSEYESDGDSDQRILGMVHGALNNGVVIFSEPALVAGFANPHDRRNVGIHEFAHVVDKQDGSIDGFGGALPGKHFEPWLELMRVKMLEAGKGRGSIDPYSKTNPQEFLAVTTEYFFESPERLQKQHPKVYEYLSMIYNQDTAELLKEEYHLLVRHKLGRNDDCPCNSGRKYKACCLRKKR